MDLKFISFYALIILILGYTLIGTGTRVDDIKLLAKSGIESRDWQIVRYEGYQYGSWGNHGGKVWYHVKDLNVENTYYRVYITMWGGELHYNYGDPEVLNRVNLNVDK